MKLFLIVAEGDSRRPEVSKEEQEETFAELATDLARAAEEAGLPVAIYAAQSLQSRKWTGCKTPEYVNGAGALVGLLQDEFQREAGAKILITLGHGALAVGGEGARADFQLLDQGQDRFLQFDHLNNFAKPTVYIGLHCYSGLLIKLLSQDIMAFDLAGSQTSTNVAMQSAVEVLKKQMPELLQTLVCIEIGEEQLKHLRQQLIRAVDSLKKMGVATASIR